MIALTASRLYTPVRSISNPLVLIQDGGILEVTSRDSTHVPPRVRHLDYRNSILAPGFIDIHIHGSAGHDVMNSDPFGFTSIESFIAKHGVTAYLPTTVTASVDDTLAALDQIAAHIEKRNREPQRQCAKSVGIHLEGPFISHAKRGVHPPEFLQEPSLELFDSFWQAARGHIKVMTIAPELDGAVEVIAEAARRGVCVSLGHTNADLSSARAGITAGARHATHTFNAMRALDHREPGVIGEVLTNSRLTADIIADGIHVDPTVVKLFLKAKGPEAAVLITDATAATGMPDGRYQLGSLEVEVKNGQCRSEGRLAGSVLTMDRAVRNAMQFANRDLQEALCLATRNPARVVGLRDREEIAPGAPADFVVLTLGGEVQETLLAADL